MTWRLRFYGGPMDGAEETSEGREPRQWVLFALYPSPSPLADLERLAAAPTALRLREAVYELRAFSDGEARYDFAEERDMKP